MSPVRIEIDLLGWRKFIFIERTNLELNRILQDYNLAFYSLLFKSKRTYNGVCYKTTILKETLGVSIMETVIKRQNSWKVNEGV